MPGESDDHKGEFGERWTSEEDMAAAETDHARHSFHDTLGLMATQLNRLRREHERLVKMHDTDAVEGVAGRVIPALFDDVAVNIVALASLVPKPDQ